MACVVVGALPWAAAPAAAQTPVAADKWIEARGSHYTLFSRAGYEKDAEFARALLDRGDVLLQKKYGVTLAGYRVDVYLYPEPNERAGLDRASLQCCSGSGEIRRGRSLSLHHRRRLGRLTGEGQVSICRKTSIIKREWG
jgi:hypothetical protein